MDYLKACYLCRSRELTRLVVAAAPLYLKACYLCGAKWKLAAEWQRVAVRPTEAADFDQWAHWMAPEVIEDDWRTHSSCHYLGVGCLIIGLLHGLPALL
jgi:hypothetical protein